MKIINKKANFKYTLEHEKYEAGISLRGDEVKAAKTNKVDLTNSHAKIIGGEMWLVGANIPGSDEPTRTRKLLLSRKEITSIGSRISQKKLTFVPVSIYTKGRLLKVRLSLGKTKRGSDKRKSLREKDIKRQTERDIKGTY